MKTNMTSTLEEWVPESRNWISDNDLIQHLISDYQILGKLVDVSLKKMNSEMEFLTKIVMEEGPASLKKHLDIFPKELRKEYLKTVLEN